MGFTFLESIPFLVPIGGVAGTEEEDALALEAGQVYLEAPFLGLCLAHDEVIIVQFSPLDKGQSRFNLWLDFLGQFGSQ